MSELSTRLFNIEKFEADLTNKSAALIKDGSPMFVVDLFVFGAVKRTLAQSSGFRKLIEARNFPSAAILLRTQIDTAMRVNGLQYLDRPDEQLREVLSGQKTFRDLISWQKTAKGKPKKMHDAFLRECFNESEPWIGNVYSETSDFVHLSFKHLFSSIAHTDIKDGVVSFVFSGEDNVTEGAYFEICDAFLHVSQLTGHILLGLFTSLHSRDNVKND